MDWNKKSFARSPYVRNRIEDLIHAAKIEFPLIKDQSINYIITESVCYFKGSRMSFEDFVGDVGFNDHFLILHFNYNN